MRKFGFAISLGGALALALGAAPMVSAQSGSAAHIHEKGHSHSHDHSHAHDHGQKAKDVYRGIFETDEVADRPLTDWAGDWQSVYPYLQNGSLDPVMAQKAAKGSKSAEEYRSYYETGYRSDIDRIEISADAMTFHRGGSALSGTYASDGFEILTYKAGNRGVRFIFKKVGGDAEAPAFVQFSDHRIAPEASDHFHIYLGEDRAALLEEVTHWPTFYSSKLSGDEIVAEMLAH